MKFDNVIEAKLIPYLEETCKIFDINTIDRCSHFISQTSHESGNFKVKSENLNYSAERLCKIWKNRFALKDIKGNYFEPLQPNDLALTIQHNPEKIANIVYANRLGNGDINSGDGWKYKGGGFIQTTGKNNYILLSDYFKVDFVKHPELILEDQWAMKSAGFYWFNRKLNTLADLGSTEDVIKKMTRKINGGYIGLDDRIDQFWKINKLLKQING